jgi:hypothetical protein
MSAAALKVIVWDQLRRRDLKVFSRWLTPAAIAGAAGAAGVAPGKGPLNLATLAWLGLASALHTAKNFADVLALVLKLLRDAPAWDHSALADLERRGRRQAAAGRRRKHDPRGQDPTAVSEEAFVQARQRVPWGFWLALVLRLADDFQAAHPARVHWKDFRLLALDGTTVALAHWQRLAEHFGTASAGKGRRRRAQARLVLLEFPQARLPWRYELAPLAESEKAVAARLLGGVRAGDLVLMDRGFWSYALFAAVAQQGGCFAIRRIAQAQLRRLRRLGRDDELVCYRPSHWRKAWAERGWPREMTLRLVRYQLRGFRPSGVVTNVLDPAAVSREEWVRLAAVDEAGRVVEPGLYHRRWEVETSFFELKVTQGLEGGLRSRTPAGIQYEVAGHLLLYLLVRWLMVEAAEGAGLADPLRLSFKGALQELGDLRQALLQASAARARHVLVPRLLERIAQHRVPLRPGRHYPRPKDSQPKDKGKGRYQRASKLKGTNVDKLEPAGA